MSNNVSLAIIFSLFLGLFAFESYSIAPIDSAIVELPPPSEEIPLSEKIEIIISYYENVVKTEGLSYLQTFPTPMLQNALSAIKNYVQRTDDTKRYQELFDKITQVLTQRGVVEEIPLLTQRGVIEEMLLLTQRDVVPPSEEQEVAGEIAGISSSNEEYKQKGHQLFFKRVSTEWLPKMKKFIEKYRRLSGKPELAKELYEGVKIEIERRVLVSAENLVATKG